MYQLYNLFDGNWLETGHPLQFPSRRQAIDYFRAMGYKRLMDKFNVRINHMLEGTFKVVKV